jgi:hypothetical protein
MTTTQDLTERNAAFASKGFVSGLTINPRGNDGYRMRRSTR